MSSQKHSYPFIKQYQANQFRGSGHVSIYYSHRQHDGQFKHNVAALGIAILWGKSLARRFDQKSDSQIIAELAAIAESDRSPLIELADDNTFAVSRILPLG